MDDIYKSIKENIDLFDTSDYPEDNEYGIPRVNKKQLGKMKDENNGRIMKQFVGLRAKLYAIDVEGQPAKKKAKGVTKASLKEITFDDYMECLNECITNTRPQNRIHHDRFQVYTMKQAKIALSWADDKRQLLPGTHETLPWGYKPSQQPPEDVEMHEVSENVGTLDVTMLDA